MELFKGFSFWILNKLPTYIVKESYFVKWNNSKPKNKMLYWHYLWKCCPSGSLLVLFAIFNHFPHPFHFFSCFIFPRFFCLLFLMHTYFCQMCAKHCHFLTCCWKQKHSMVIFVCAVTRWTQKPEETSSSSCLDNMSQKCACMHSMDRKPTSPNWGQGRKTANVNHYCVSFMDLSKSFCFDFTVFIPLYGTNESNAFFSDSCAYLNSKLSHLL